MLGVLAGLLLTVATGTAQYVEDSVDVGARAVGSLVYNSREDVLYGASEEGTFFAISCDSNRVVESLHLQYAFRVAYDSIDNKAYCTFYGPDWQDSLLVVDGQTHTRARAISIPGATMPVWDPVSDRVYVSCQSTDKVAVVDCRTDSLLAYIPVGACPIKLYINPLRRKLYVQNGDDGTISIVNMTTNQVVKALAVGGVPNAGYYSGRADKFYTAASFGYVAAIDGQGDSVVAQIQVAPYSEVLSAAGNEGSNLVMFGIYAEYCYTYAISTLTDSVTAISQVTGLPYGLLYSQTTDRFYCGNGVYGSVSVITGDGTRIVKTLAAGEDPFVFACAPRHNRVYVGQLNSSKVFVIRDTTDGVEESGPGQRTLAGSLRVWPNPFRRTITAAGRLGERPLRVYSPQGALVGTAAPSRADGRYQFATWNGLDGTGQPVPDGVYIVEAAGVRAKVVKAR